MVSYYWENESMAKRRVPRLSLGRLQELAAKRKADLEKRQDILENELRAIEAELLGAAPSAGTKKTKRGRAGKVKRKRVVRQRGGQPSLRDVLIGVLQKKTSGMDLKELAASARSTGYKTKSKNFDNTVYQCVYASNEIIRDKRSKKYRLKGRSA